MNKYKVLLSVLLLCGCLSGNAAAQSRAYRTRKLADLAGQLEQRGISLPAPGRYDAAKVCPGKQVQMELDLFGKVGFIGLQLFNDSLKRHFDRPVYDFVERYLLELLLCESREEVLTRLREDKVELTFNNFSYETGTWELPACLALVQDSLWLNFSSVSNCYMVDWRNDSASFHLIFPKQYELIHGADKAEMEQGFMEELARVELPARGGDTRPVTELQATKKKGYYLKRGTVYLANTLHSNTYYKAIDTERATLFFEKEMPGESLANLFLRGFCGDRKLVLQMTHNRYGNQKTRFDVDIARFVAHCRANRCEIYFATEKLDGKRMTGTVLVQNPDLGYNHLLHFDCPMEAFERLRPVVQVSLYTYIPTHNIKNLFDDDNEK